MDFRYNIDIRMINDIRKIKKDQANVLHFRTNQVLSLYLRIRTC